MRTGQFILEEGQPITPTTLVYRPTDYAFDSEPRPNNCPYAVGVNELELMIEAERYRVVFVTGYCPHPSWQQSKLKVPNATRGGLYFRAKEELIAGTTIGITSRGSRWSVFVDPSIGWVCLGDPNKMERAVEFAPGCIAVLEQEELKALWLHPRELPRDIQKSNGPTHSRRISPL